jgi:hypothetical protein
MTLDHLAADWQPHARSLVDSVAVQAIKGGKDPLEVLFVEAYTVVLDEDLAGSAVRGPPGPVLLPFL